MVDNLIPPREPAHPERVHPPMIDAKKSHRWEYKLITQNLGREGPLDESELNVLGNDTWELTALLHHGEVATFYFKRWIGK